MCVKVQKETLETKAVYENWIEVINLVVILEYS